jgi:hypothetical protein
MHVLPLPFGMALALVPKREAHQLRGRERVRPLIRNATTPRDRILGDVRSLYLRNHI